MTLKELEEIAIHAALERSGGHVTAAYRALGLGKTTMYRKLVKLNYVVKGGIARKATTPPHAAQPGADDPTVPDCPNPDS